MAMVRSAFAALAVVCLLACGASNGGPSAPATPSGGGAISAAGLCALFPLDRAAAALGEPVTGSEANEGTIGGLTRFCRYKGASGAILDLEHSPAKDRATWDAEMDSTEMSDNTAVEGIGDAAWLSDSSGLGPGARIAVAANGGSIWVTIAKVGGDDATLAAAVQQAARELLAAVAE